MVIEESHVMLNLAYHVMLFLQYYKIQWLKISLNLSVRLLLRKTFQETQEEGARGGGQGDQGHKRCISPQDCVMIDLPKKLYLSSRVHYCSLLETVDYMYAGIFNF